MRAWSFWTACYVTARWAPIALEFARCPLSGTLHSSRRGWTTGGASGPARRSRKLCRPDRGRPDLADAEVRQGIAHRVDRMAHLGRPDGPDAANAEGLELRQLARVQDEAPVAHLVVERLERITRIRGRMKGDDDRRLDPRIEERPEAYFLHARDQRLAVCRVAGKARLLPAGGKVLLERRI